MGNHQLALHIVDPLGDTHTHTVIFLHGRGDNGPDFAEELFASTLASGLTLQRRFPSWRWVFPSAPDRWSTAFQEEHPAWFEAHSLSDISLRDDLQMDGMRESVAQIVNILVREVHNLGGHTDKLVLAGISQGAAVGLWALLSLLESRTGESMPALGAFVGASCWLPFAPTVGSYLAYTNIDQSSTEAATPSPNVLDGTAVGGAQDFVTSMLKGASTALAAHGRELPLLATPVCLGHGTDDAYVDVSLGYQAKTVLSDIGFDVTWKRYAGAEQEGHWFKEPEELDDIAKFLAAIKLM